MVGAMDFSVANDLLVFCFFLYNDFEFHKTSNNKLSIVYCLSEIFLHIYNLYSFKRVDMCPNVIKVLLCQLILISGM